VKNRGEFFLVGRFAICLVAEITAKNYVISCGLSNDWLAITVKLTCRLFFIAKYYPAVVLATDSHWELASLSCPLI
jgi:hypothetical protein